MQRAWKLVLGTALLMALLGGISRAATVTPSSSDFGGQGVGTTGSAASFLLGSSPSLQGPCLIDDGMGGCIIYTYFPFATSTTALGGAPGATTRVGDFSVHNVDCPESGLSGSPIAPVSSFCHFEVSFAPTAAGPRVQTLTFPDGVGPGGTTALSLSGTGVGPPASSAGATPHKKKCKKKHRAAAAKKCRKAR